MRAKDEVYKPESERVIESGKNTYGGKFKGPPSLRKKPRISVKKSGKDAKQKPV